MKSTTSPLLLWSKRLLLYILGLFLTAAGVVFSARSSLGVSPVSSLGNVLYQIGQSAGAPAYVNLGNCTTAVFCVYLLIELLLLGRKFKPAMLLQIAVSLLFGQLVNLASAVLAVIVGLVIMCNSAATTWVIVLGGIGLVYTAVIGIIGEMKYQR